MNHAANTPPDRSHLATEQRNPRSTSLDTLSVADCIRLINDEDSTIAGAVARAAPAITRFIEALEERMRASPEARLIYLGAGTSGRLGVLDASECPPTFQTPPGMIVGIIAGGDAALRTSSEGKEDNPAGAAPEFARLTLAAHDTILGIAAGGTTPYVLGALDLAKRAGALTALLTCARIDTPADVDHHLFIDTGPEILTGSTRMKAGTATKLVLNTITTTLMVRRGKTYENLMVDLRATNDKLRDRAARIITTLCSTTRDKSFALLDRAEGSVKLAVIMHRTNCPLDEAAQKLARASGNLREACR